MHPAQVYSSPPSCGTLTVMAIVLHYGENKIGVAEGVHVKNLESEIQGAVRDGGGWVSVEREKGGVARLFVSAGLYISIGDSGSGGQVFAL